MNCRWIQQHIHSILDGDLPSRDRTAFDQHVSTCSPCAEFVRRSEEEEALLRSVLESPEVPPGFAEAVMHDVRTSPPAVVPAVSIALNRWRWWPLLGAAAAIAVVYVAIRPFSGSDSVSGERAVVGVERARPHVTAELKREPVSSLPVVATVVSVRGSAVVRASGSEEWHALAVEETLRLGSRLKTEAGAALTIRVADVTTTQIDQGSSVRLTETGLFVDIGRVFSSVEPGGQGFAVETADACATVTGTRFEVDRRAAGMTCLRVVEGTVTFANANGTVSVGPNMEATATAESGPGRLLHADHLPALAWASLDEESFEFAVDIRLTVRETDDGDAGLRAARFQANLDYGETRYGDLWLYCRVTDASGVVVLQQRKRVSSREHRYRVKKVAFGDLKAGSYTAQFRIGHGEHAAVAEIAFSTR